MNPVATIFFAIAMVVAAIFFLTFGPVILNNLIKTFAVMTCAVLDAFMRPLLGKNYLISRLDADAAWNSAFDYEGERGRGPDTTWPQTRTGWCSYAGGAIVIVSSVVVVILIH